MVLVAYPKTEMRSSAIVKNARDINIAPGYSSLPRVKISSSSRADTNPPNEIHNKSHSQFNRSKGDDELGSATNRREVRRDL